jgi:hypothetical protein
MTTTDEIIYNRSYYTFFDEDEYGGNVYRKAAAYVRARHQAFRMDDGRLYPLEIFDKADQDFEKYATPWERAYSTLISTGNRFKPVLDAKTLVVGHTGSVSGGYHTDLIAPLSALADAKGAASIDFRQVLELLNADVPLFVFDRDSRPPDNWVFCDLGTTEHRHEVITTVDGQVINIRAFNTGFVESVAYSPTDFILVVRILVRLGAAIGTRLLKSLARRTGTRIERSAVLNGPTQELAKKSEQTAVKQLEAGKAYINKNRAATATEQQVGRQLNQAAQVGQLRGIKRVEGGELGKVGAKGRKGDYDFVRTDGTVLKGDLYEPTQSDVKKITSQIFSKSGQADIVVVQLGSGASWKLNSAAATQIAQDVLKTPGLSIQRVIVREGRNTLVDMAR